MCFSKLFRKKENEMQYTENLELNLPEDTDYIESTSREAINDNFEILDVIGNKYVVASYDLVNTNSNFLEGKIWFYNDSTWVAKSYVYCFYPSDIAVGTVIANGSYLFAAQGIGSCSLPSTCPYTLSALKRTYATVYPFNFNTLTVGSLTTTIGSSQYTVHAGFRLNSGKLQQRPNSEFILANGTGASVTITESDTSLYPRCCFYGEGTYTTT